MHATKSTDGTYKIWSLETVKASQFFLRKTIDGGLASHKAVPQCSTRIQVWSMPNRHATSRPKVGVWFQGKIGHVHE